MSTPARMTRFSCRVWPCASERGGVAVLGRERAATRLHGMTPASASCPPTCVKGWEDR